MNPENTFYSVKRFIGRRMAEVREESKQVPYQVRRVGWLGGGWALRFSLMSGACFIARAAWLSCCRRKIGLYL